MTVKSKLKIATALEQTVLEISDKVSQSKINLDWRFSNEISLFLEIVTCILGSGVTFELSKSAGEYLHEIGILTKLIEDPFKEEISDSVKEELKKPIFNSNKGYQRYRYPIKKAEQIVKTAQQIYGSNQTLKSILGDSSNEFSARLKLTKYCSGIGPKQSSLFLRNINFGDKLAILDSHVINYMQILEMLNSQPKISTINQYIEVEKKLIAYASNLCQDLKKLDIAIWIVMRSCNVEIKKCLL